MDFILEDLDWRKILIRRYKNYHLNEDDLAVILLINELNRGYPHLISPEEIEPYTTMSAEKIESIMSKLIKAGYASIEGVSFSVNTLKKKIFDDTVKEAALAEDETEDKNIDLTAFYQRIQEVIKRQVTSLECDVVSSWIAQNMTIEELNSIIDQVKTKRKTISIAVIDKEYKVRKKNKNKIKDNPEAEKELSVSLYDNISK